MLKIRLELPEPFGARARYGWEELARRMGWQAVFVDAAADAHVHQSADPIPARHGVRSVAVPFEPALYRPESVCAPAGIDGWTVWTAQGGAPESFDPAGSVFRLLTCLDESAIDEASRNRRGIFANSALPEKRREVEAEPLVENAAGLLRGRVLAAFPELAAAARSRWPDGKRWAVVLSHDADAVHAGAPLEFANSLAKGIRRRSTDHLRLAALGLTSLAGWSADPLFVFPEWRAWESARGLKSTFYLFHRPTGVPRDPDDCRSSVADPRTDWKLLREMARDGWEFGLHPSIRVKSVPGAFAAARLWLEERLGSPVEGIRHHFWALDWRRPFRTHEEHLGAGFLYDSSIAWRDRPGFRAGTSLPYRPCDPETGRVLPFLVLPCSLMDRHALYAGIGGGRTSRETALASADTLIAQVRRTGGLLVLNWHQETGSDRGAYAGFRSVLQEIMDRAGRDGSAWFATAREVRAHWTANR